MNCRLLATLICGSLIVVAPPSWARKWTDNTGKFSVDAEMVEVEGQNVTLKRADGRVVTLPIRRLSAADRRFLRSLRNPPAEKTEIEHVEDAAALALNGAIATGKIHGQDFVLDQTKFQPGGGILTLRQGEDFFPDRGVILFLFLDEGQSPEGKTFNVTGKEGFAASVPHIHMKWMEPGGRIPQTQMFMGGYQMKLQFGKASNGIAPAKIDLRIPDETKSTISGAFEIDLSGEKRKQGGGESGEHDGRESSARDGGGQDGGESDERPDLGVDEIFLNEKGFVRARIRNRGTAPVTDARVVFKVDAVRKSVIGGINLDPGDEYPASSQRLPPGSHTVEVTVDPDNKIAESDETNNTMEVTLTSPP